MRAAHRTIGWLSATWIAPAILLAFPQPGGACLAHYHSPDELVANSPLVLIGQVEAVEKRTEPTSKKGRGLFLLGGGMSGPDPDGPGPAIARVRVLRVLKGTYTKLAVAVDSGPIGSCAPYEVHYPFTVGETGIFILPAMPGERGVALSYGGSLRALQDLPTIEARIARMRQYQAAYLAAIAREMPDVHAAAGRLAERMRTESGGWPELTRAPMKDVPGYFTDEEGPAFVAARDKLVKDLVALDVETVRTAAALDWLSEEPASWSRRALWRHAVEALVKAKPKQVVDAERKRICRELTRIGVTAPQIDRYLAAVEEGELDCSLRFPPAVPYPHREHTPENLTTEFLLEFDSYDRGAMFRNHGMDFDALAHLDADRVATIIPALYGSDDEQLRIVAYRVIERLPGTAFLGLVLDEMERDPEAWRRLVVEKDGETAKRLTALLNLSITNLTAWGQERFWDRLRLGECFEDVCLRRAIEELAKSEETLRRPPEKGIRDVHREPGYVAALRRYLAAAVAKIEGQPADTANASYFRLRLEPRLERQKKK